MDIFASGANRKTSTITKDRRTKRHVLTCSDQVEVEENVKNSKPVSRIRLQMIAIVSSPSTIEFQQKPPATAHSSCISLRKYLGVSEHPFPRDVLLSNRHEGCETGTSVIPPLVAHFSLCLQSTKCPFETCGACKDVSPRLRKGI